MGSVLLSIMYCLLYWEGNRQIVMRLRARYPHVSQIWTRIIWQAVLVLLYSLLVALIAHWGLRIWRGTHPTLVESSHLKSDILLGLGISILITTFYESAYLFQQWKASVIEAERIKVQQMQAQLESLRHQVNPHFLFNSLNTLSSLIPLDPDRSVDFVQRLSQVYRYVLEVNAHRFIPLRRELEFVQAYLFLLKVRHREGLHVNISVPDSEQSSLTVPLALQILLENAVKHNVTAQRRPLYVDIFVQDNSLIVRNNLQPKRQALDSTGLGLRNLRERYELLFRQSIEVVETEDHFTVSLPLLQENSNVLSLPAEHPGDPSLGDFAH